LTGLECGPAASPPAHFDPNGITMDEIPLKQMILPLVVFEDTKYFDREPNHRLTVKDAKEWEKRTVRVRER
jgi:kynurenine formamidase